MDIPTAVLAPVAVVVVIGAFLLRMRVRRVARERAEREPRVPTTGRAVAQAAFGLVVIAVGFAILMTAEDPMAGTGTRRFGWLPAWIQTVGLVAFGAFFLFLAANTTRGVRERRRRGDAAPAFDALPADTDVHDDARP